MNLIDLSLNKQQIIGSFETTQDNVGASVINLASQFGMSNPSTPVSTNSKSIIIKRNGKKYTVILVMFNPPVVLSWSSPFDLKSLNQMIESIAKNGKKIGYINLFKVNKQDYIQLAIG